MNTASRTSSLFSTPSQSRRSKNSRRYLRLRLTAGARIERSCIGYLGDYTIRPRHAIEGHAYAKYKKGADSIEITLPIGDKKYVFNFLVFQFLVPKSLKYLKINSKTVAHVNIYGYIYIC